MQKIWLILLCTGLFCVQSYGEPQKLTQEADQTNTVYHLDAGPLQLDIYISSTAHIFHVVDQIAQWSEFCHRQYISYFEGMKGGLSKDDQDLLAQHQAIRRVHGWGQGLEQTFYTSLDLDSALDLGIKEGHLTKEEAETERRILTHFKERVERLLLEEMPTLNRFVQKLLAQQSNIVTFANDTSQFVSSDKLTVPIYLLANPHERNCGGGFNGGRLTLEIAKSYDMYPTLLHELFHAFLRTKQEAIDNAARSVPGLDTETLSEGLAYAYNPGIIHAGDSDQLLSKVSSLMAKGASLKDSYTRFNMYGLALRPLLKESLFGKRQTLEDFLPRATDAWLVLIELDNARGTKSDSRMYDYRKDPRHSIFLFGIWDKEGCQLLKQISNQHFFGRDHIEDQYREMLTKNAKPGDTIIILLSLDNKDRIPVGFSDLIPSPWSEIENRLKQEQTVFMKGNAREMTVYLLATPTAESLRTEFRRLVTEKKFISNPTEKGKLNL
ncbi:MAG: hypothetical protein FVQ79_09780 [Planctomycetes bacterium]|nr:hypothetical protein [Planctomycetota bacterium]